MLSETLTGQDVTGEIQSGLLQQTTRLQGLLQITIDALTAGNFNGVPALVNPDTTAVAEPIILDFTTIVAAKTTIQSDSIDFADVYGPVQYDRDAYRLIVEYALDGIVHDLLYDGNFATFNNARAYYVDGVLQLIVPAQTTPTIGAYTNLKTILSSIVQETYAGQEHKQAELQLLQKRQQLARYWILLLTFLQQVISIRLQLVYCQTLLVLCLQTTTPSMVRLPPCKQML